MLYMYTHYENKKFEYTPDLLLQDNPNNIQTLKRIL
jgi:hypothetical protein